MPQALKKIRDAMWNNNGKNLRKSRAWQLTKVRNQKEVIEQARNKGRKGSFRVIDGSLSSQEFGVGASVSKVQKAQSYSEVTLLKMILVRTQYSLNKSSASQIDSRKSNGHYFKTTRMRRTSSSSIRLRPGQNERCTDVIEHSKVRMSRYLDTSTESEMAKIIEDPVVPLEPNLYGHPLAGLLWERQFEKVLLEHCWETV